RDYRGGDTRSRIRVPSLAGSVALPRDRGRTSKKLEHGLHEAANSDRRTTGRPFETSTPGCAGARPDHGIDLTGDLPLLRCVARGSRGSWPVERLLWDPR